MSNAVFVRGVTMMGSGLEIPRMVERWPSTAHNASDGHRWQNLHNYSTSIADAWLVLEKLAESDVISEIGMMPGGFWKTRCYQIDEDDEVTWLGFAYCANAPESICRAAVKSLATLSSSPTNLKEHAE